MPEGYLSISAEEREQSHRIRRTVEKSLIQRQAAERPEISRRQFKRLVGVWKHHVDAGLVRQRPGRVTHNRLAEDTRVPVEQLFARDSS
jgi:predicted DNA-binding protein (UPF0251 family)